MTTRILLVEDEPATRRRLAALLRAQPDFTLTGAVGDAASARSLLAQKPDVLLADLGLPDGDGVELIREACRLLPGLHAMVLTAFSEETRVVAAIEAGARSYLLKDDAFVDIARALREMLGGGSPLSPSIARVLVQRLRLSRPAPHASPGPLADDYRGATDSAKHLTGREVEILRLVARGYSHAEVASALSLSVYTVGCHVQHIYRKLAVNSRAEAIFEAIELGLVEMRR